MTEYGAKMERGIVSSVTDAGAVIRSIDRPGIVTPPLKRMDGTLPENGEVVWFYMTDDGQGAVAEIGNNGLPAMKIYYDNRGNVVIEEVYNAEISYDANRNVVIITADKVSA